MTKEEEWLLHEKYKGEKSEAFFADLDRLVAGEPVAYIIGHIPFLGCTIHLDSRPLIPRTETEFWVERIIPEINKVKNPHILDLCAGSGCIGIAILKHIPDALVDFAEITDEHLTTIEKNIEANDIEPTRTHIIQSDLFENVHAQYDFILSNPPYIDPELDRTEQSVQRHEPANALYGGHMGLEFISKIIEVSPYYLKEHGRLVIEHEPEQVQKIIDLASKFGLVAHIHNDQYNVPRYTVLTRESTQAVSQ